MLILSLPDIQSLIQRVGLEPYMQQLMGALHSDFSRWQDFRLSPRHATHFDQGVIELMPCADEQYYAFKYVNGHPCNTRNNKLCVVALGQLSDSVSGYPLLLSEMTLLTAIRTAVTGTLAAQYLARKNASVLAIVGCGAQAEFQVTAFCSHYDIKEIRYFDTDKAAMQKFSSNLNGMKQKFRPCSSIETSIATADIIITATAVKQRQSLFNFRQLKPGVHIHAMGGDCPGKTELDSSLLDHCKVVVEYLPQTLQEGEIQQWQSPKVHAELWQLVKGLRQGRNNDQELTLFDSVGFALEDYSILRFTYELAQQHQVGVELPLIPQLDDPKNLFALLSAKNAAMISPAKRDVL